MNPIDNSSLLQNSTDIALSINGTLDNYSLHLLDIDLLNGTSAVDDSLAVEEILVLAFMSSVLGLLILATVAGNTLVIAAVLKERNLQGVGNCLVLSLAVADLMVACLVMPMSAVYEVTDEWILGPELCDVWTSCDVLCCTASILHLLAIAVDRYWAVTNVDYIRQRGPRNIAIMLAIVWGIAVVVSLAPTFGWKDPNFRRRVEVEKRCLISQDVSYQIFATCSTFYVPLIATLLLYWKIYRVARKRIRHKPGNRPMRKTQKVGSNSLAPPPIEMSVVSELSTSLPNSHSNTCDNGISGSVPNSPLPGHHKKGKRRKKESLESKRERKAAKTLAIITGVFVFCWLPFFVMVLLMTLCSMCEPDNTLFSFFLWLGYANSMLNPVIYTIFSPDFRNAFKHMLCSIRRNQRTFYVR